MKLSMNIFFEFRNLRGAIEGIDTGYLNQVGSAGPVLGVLRFTANISKQSHPILASPVNAQLIDLEYGIWQNISKHLDELRGIGSKAMGREMFEKWSNAIISKSADREMLLAWSVGTFIESHMRSTSAAHREMLIKLLTCLVIGEEDTISSTFPQAKNIQANSEFIIPLIAGRSASSLLCHSRDTLLHWPSELDAATSLLIPQVSLEALNQMQTSSKGLLIRALTEEVITWETRPSSINEFMDWNWLPNFEI